MPGVFPGMDPFLESPDLWPAFHHQLMATLSGILMLGERYQVRIAERRYPSELPDGGEQREEYIEIHQANAGNLVTLVDLVSPANKTTDAGRRAYLHTRQQAKEAMANMVEIDLVLQGQPTLDYSRKGLPEWDYAVTVTRATQPDRYEIYTAVLFKKRLPRFRVPLASDDRDAVVDLQTVVTKAFEQGGFAGKIHYRPEVVTGLKEVHRQELAERLGWPSPPEAAWTHEDIQLAAYDIWKEQGCPEGRADEHWRLAVERLQQRRRA